MAKKSKIKNSYTNLVPVVKNPFINTYDCPISEELNINKYNVTIDSDPIDNHIYLDLGYDDKDEYSSAFYLTPAQAAEIGNKLVEFAIHTSMQYSDYLMGEMENSMLRHLVDANMVEEIIIEPIKLFTMDVEDSLFGRMIIDISYKATIYDKSKSYTILSQPIDTDDISYIDNLRKYLEEHGVKSIKIDDLQYNFLCDSICTLRKKWLKTHKGKNLERKEFMKPREDLAQLAKDTMEKIKQSGKPN